MPDIAQKITVFVKESKAELKKVNWPSREETTRFTLFVVFLSLLVAAFLGVLDYIFIKLLEVLII